MEKKMYSFYIDRKLPSLNEYTRLNRTNYRAGNRMKGECQSYIRGCIYYKLKKLQIENPVIIHTTWIEDNKRRDLDNIRFAIKFILDALVETGVLKNDSQKYVKGFTDKFEYKKTAGVFVEIEEIEEKEEKK